MLTLQRRRKIRQPRTHLFHDWVRRADKKEIDWAASGWAGLAGGTALTVWQLTLAPLLLGIGTGEFVHRVAAIALGGYIDPSLTAFTGLVGMTALVVHLPLSLLYARLLAGSIHDMRALPAALFGAAFGAVLYAVNFYGFTALFPWLIDARGWTTLSGHLLYGAVAAAVYEGLLHAHD